VTQSDATPPARGYVVESEVAAAVAAYHEACGRRVRHVLRTGAPGADVLVEEGGLPIAIECKGGGSEQPASKKYGLPFSRLQEMQSWDAGFAQLPQLESGLKTRGERPAAVGLAVPDTPTYREMFRRSRRWLELAGAGVWFVDAAGRVEEALPPRLRAEAP
jgi:hypothetical protein